MKRIVVWFLIAVMCLGCLASCARDAGQKDGETQSETQSETQNGGQETHRPTPNMSLTLLENGKTDYQIVYSDGKSYCMNSNGQELATMLQEAIQSATGVQLPVTDDQGERKDQEILIGFTNRKDEYTSPIRQIEFMEGFSSFVEGQRIILEAGSNAGAFLAVQLLIEELLGVNVLEDPSPEFEESKDALFLDRRYEAAEMLGTEDFPYLGYNLSDFKIYIEANQYFQKRAALHFQRHMKSQESVTLSLVTSGYTTKSGNYFYFRQDNNLKNGAFRISHEGNTIFLTAGDYHGYTGAISAVLQMKKELGFFPFLKEETLNLSHADFLSDLNETSAYAYNRVGEYRMMFYNVLWDGMHLEERAKLQVEMIKQYAPDVIGFQEFSNTRRTHIAIALKSMGYEETMLYTSVATKGADYYNYVPIFYNSATTKCIDTGYLRYVAQHSEAESKSKSMTWAVMESKASGERYIVVNTHMCTQADSIKGQQAVEAITVINSVLQKYPNLPTFLGGDYNGKYANSNFKYFASTGGFTDIESNNLAKEFTCKTKAHHQPYTLEKVQEVILRPENASPIDLNRPDLSVDHIMVRNKTNVEIGVYGVVVDDCTDHGGDHYPIFIDFTIQ